jgi:hypothetical protein
LVLLVAGGGGHVGGGRIYLRLRLCLCAGVGEVGVGISVDSGVSGVSGVGVRDGVGGVSVDVSSVCVGVSAQWQPSPSYANTYKKKLKLQEEWKDVLLKLI